MRARLATTQVLATKPTHLIMQWTFFSAILCFLLARMQAMTLWHLARGRSTCRQDARGSSKPHLLISCGWTGCKELR